ncbi:MAG: Lrp/AsnC family transcriptional regulator [Oscillospiraceae bacterium]
MDSLLELLKQNARLSGKELAVMLGKTEAEVAAQIKEYESRGIIKGYSAIINEELACKDTVIAFIELKVSPQAQYGYDEIAKTVMQYDEVEGVSLMSGAFDLAVTVKGNSLRMIAEFVSQRLATIDGVLSTATHFVLQTYKDKGIVLFGEKIDERGFVSP